MYRCANLTRVRKRQNPSKSSWASYLWGKLFLSRITQPVYNMQDHKPFPRMSTDFQSMVALHGEKDTQTWFQHAHTLSARTTSVWIIKQSLPSKRLCRPNEVGRFGAKQRRKLYIRFAIPVPPLLIHKHAWCILQSHAGGHYFVIYHQRLFWVTF